MERKKSRQKANESFGNRAKWMRKKSILLPTFAAKSVLFVSISTSFSPLRLLALQSIFLCTLWSDFRIHLEASIRAKIRPHFLPPMLSNRHPFLSLTCCTLAKGIIFFSSSSSIIDHISCYSLFFALSSRMLVLTFAYDADNFDFDWCVLHFASVQ